MELIFWQNLMSLAPLWLTVISGVFIGASAGFIGSFLVLRKMSLSGDALSHVALPGMGLALLVGINPFWGAWIFLMLAVLGMWWIKIKTKLSLETLVGVFFTFSVAIGILIIPELELIESLFGDIQKMTVINSLLAVILGGGIIFSLYFLAKKLMLVIISGDLAKVNKIKVDKLDFLFLFLLGIVVALGVQAVGALLMGALVIIPAATSKNISWSFSSYTSLSIIFGGLSMLLALPLASYWQIPSGATVILVATVFFIFSLFIYYLKK